MQGISCFTKNKRTRINNNGNNNQNEKTQYKIEFLFMTELHPIKYSKEFFNNADNNCSICLENFVENKSIICLTPCSHIFHFDCLIKWSENVENSFKCPNCNFDFLSEENPVVIHVVNKKDNKKDNKNNLNICNYVNPNDNDNNNLHINNFNYIHNSRNLNTEIDTVRTENNLRNTNRNT